MIGISLYPDKSLLSQDQEYLNKAKKLGYQVVFMSFLQVRLEHPKQSIQRIKESAHLAHSMGYSVTLDIHPMVFDLLSIENYNLRYFYDMGIDTLRLDSVFDGKVEAAMSHNPYGIKLELNMSNDTHYLEYLMDFHPDVQRLQGSHNFYPQRYTALSKETFQKCSLRFQERHLKSAAFITSQTASISPWPISEGLCSLECHRDLALDVQAAHLKMMQLSDTIIIANAYASDEELHQVREVENRTFPSIRVEFCEQVTTLEKNVVLDQIHEYRGDASDYVIRSSKGRGIFGKEEFPAHAPGTKIKRGDILVLNETYGQYKAEMQIALQDRQADSKINVVGHICEDEFILMEELRPFQKFKLMESQIK